LNRRSIRLLTLLTAGLCSAVPGCIPLSGQRSQPAVLYRRAGAENGAPVQKGGFVLGVSGERREFATREAGSMYIGSWLVPGQTLDNQLQTLSRLERFAVCALVAAVLTFMGFLYWKRQATRRRIWSLRISPEELHSMMGSGHPPLIVDLRSPLDMLPDPRMIPGAIRFTQEEISVAASALPNDRDIVLYCTCPRQESSVTVALSLANAGLTHVRLLAGGFEAWKQLGYELRDATDKIHWPGQTRATTGAQAERPREYESRFSALMDTEIEVRR
jgi:rhodanese-related sulfurtransferase